MKYYLILIGVLFIYMNFWFVISLIRKRNDVADIAWGLGFTLIGWASFFISDNPSARGILINTLVSIWGLRLAWHIYSRNKGKTEDYRYLAWRKEWGKWFYPRSYLQIYLLQGFLLFLIVLPVLVIHQNSESSLGWIDLIGCMIWLIGFYFEYVGDAQLTQFVGKPENKGKLMQGGLWAYTRHPNYFGEVTQWWGLGCIALSVPNGIFSIIGPITITFLILQISGIPMLEKKMAEKPGFEEYARKVSKFFPLPRRK